jgi:hypothetical protein
VRRQGEAATALWINQMDQRPAWQLYGTRMDRGQTKAPSPLRSAGALQMKSPNQFSREMLIRAIEP